MEDRNHGLARTEPNENKANTWAYTTRKTVNRHANSHIESCGAGVTDLNIQLERLGLRTLTDFRLLFHAAEKYEAGKDKQNVRVIATVHSI